MALTASLAASSPCGQGRTGGQRLSDLPKGEAVVSACPSPPRAQRGGLIAPAEATRPVAPGCQALEQAAWALSVTECGGGCIALWTQVAALRCTSLLFLVPFCNLYIFM